MGYTYSVENVTRELDQSDEEKLQIVQNVANKLREYAWDIDKIHELRYMIQGHKHYYSPGCTSDKGDSIYIRDGVWLNVDKCILSLGIAGKFPVAIEPVIAKIVHECLWLNHYMGGY